MDNYIFLIDTSSSTKLVYWDVNGESFGTKIENVNYAIKASYLLNLYNMLPDNIKISNSFKSEKKELKEQIKILKNFVCLINVN